MNKQTLKLLAGMPPEMLTAWEKMHRGADEKWNIRYITKNYRKRVWLSLGLFVAWLFLFVFLGLKIGKHIGGEWGDFIAFASLFLGFGGILLTEFVSHRGEWGSILQSLETAVKDEKLGLMAYVEEGFDLKRIDELVHMRLVQDAQSVFAAEEHFIRVCRADRLSEAEVEMACRLSSQRRAFFNQVLARAVEFGLSDGKKERYFKEAMEIRNEHRAESIELIECLELSSRALYCLKEEGITTISELEKRSKKDLLMIPNFSRRSVNEIELELAKLGRILRK